MPTYLTKLRISSTWACHRHGVATRRHGEHLSALDEVVNGTIDFCIKESALDSIGLKNSRIMQNQTHGLVNRYLSCVVGVIDIVHPSPEENFYARTLELRLKCTGLLAWNSGVCTCTGIN